MIGWFKGLVYSLLLGIGGGGLCAQAADIDRLVIVKSSDNSFFDQTITTLVDRLGGRIRHEIVGIDGLGADTRPGALYVGLGLSAIEAIRARESARHAIHAYLTEEQLTGLGPGKGHLYVLLDQPLRRYLAFTRFLLDIDSVGILSDRAEASAPEVTATLERLGLRLDRYLIDADNKLLPVLRRLLRDSDALLMLPRQSIYNRETLKGVLLTSYRQRRPVVSYSPAHVKSGALASIYSSPGDIGLHLSMLIERRLEHRLPRNTVYQYARFYSIAINYQVARSLGVVLPDKDELRQRIDGLEP